MCHITRREANPRRCVSKMLLRFFSVIKCRLHPICRASLRIMNRMGKRFDLLYWSIHTQEFDDDAVVVVICVIERRKKTDSRFFLFFLSVSSSRERGEILFLCCLIAQWKTTERERENEKKKISSRRKGKCGCIFICF